MKLAVVLASAASLARAAQVTPIQKVVQLLTDFEANVIAEGEEAQKVYAEFSQFCEDRSRQLAHEVKTGSSEVESLKATIAEEESTTLSLNAKMEELSGNIATDEADLKAATTIREREHKDFVKEEGELAETVDMIRRATGILEREMSKGAASMIQQRNVNSLSDALRVMVQASALSSADASKLSAFLQSAEDAKDSADEPGAPEAAAYEGHSGDIIEVLESLRDKAEDQLNELRKKEMNDLHNFEMLKQSLVDELKFANKELADAKKGLAVSAEAKSSAQGDLDIASKELKTNGEAKAQLHQSCLMRATDYEAETKSRGEELKAIAEAKRALQENTAGAEATSYGGASFLQVISHRSAISSAVDLANFEAVRVIRDIARKENSPELAQLAQRMSSMINLGAGGTSSDPFGKVKGLIRDMLERLQADAAADASKKAYCDKELAETSEKKTQKSKEIRKLSTKIDQMSSTSAQLKEEVAALQAALAKLASSQSEMDRIRSEERAAFAKSRADMKQGLQGVKLALKILNEYYASSGKAHNAQSGGSSGIIGMLEVVESDFSKSLAEIETAEDTAATEYEKTTKENQIERAMKEKDVEHKTRESAYLDKTSSELSTDRSSVQAELDAVVEYLKKIEEQCIAKAETYSDRRARREAEIAGLKQALEILSSETALLQRQAHAHLRGVSRHA
eukprot:CAMPEP_0176041624 /NCGR_PEP_ID=MMETSP0120_2-20121206/20647_1 /TAXON_ID=160619 /ORGANISM="Kryptoperidinium foliaceum, Strain CCMP 1326" /LENGTH=685 /DNA_ID=CAMNT_0017375027 /DNA_START=55 /DNA_END=2112 /DNA_ORIENTATION=+